MEIEHAIAVSMAVENEKKKLHIQEEEDLQEALR